MLYRLYYLLILLFFMPLNIFADSSENCSSFTTIINDKTFNQIKDQSLDFSYCDLVGINLDNLDLKNINLLILI